ncbi:amino acid ABC transporter permease [Sulfurospirillum diekertiae]|uniref:Inner membrane amino-acid ABC transporter permease protein YhdY n=1 Tax=Sulfurospirillum diekertiae TaxID=1854492 RepID=A0A1Y0HL53_9BACT|nr:amino acid ABC transporter permease [Sulfurospirillum diekertiae]ARU48829.1 Inner membrane amino-acid ABC transporter permease protein YhdY [Sulfurospirillum diekertiae]ASC93650.1 Inner membrane amino-acid ABC transporter permease protein YhdY [Sulfurospirillum diekertiae]
MAIYEKKQERKAPINTKGATFWIRENLFSSPMNVALTLLGVMILFWIIPPFIKWAYINANFSGSTREDCVSGGACWVFIRMKIDMFMYGFYPSELRWRVNSIYILFFVLLASFKYLKNSVAKIVLAHVYFIIGFFLVHGGFFGMQVVPTDKWGGLMLTIVVAAVGIVAAFPIGVILALGRASHLPIIKSISVTYIEFIRGVPLITILFMSSIILPLFFPEGISFDKLLRALIGIALFESAYIAENIRGGLQSIPKGQYEAADAIGLSYWQKMFLVILPQALKVAIPNLVGVSIALFQDTTLVLIIGLFDLLAMVRLSAADSYWLGYETEGYVFVTFIFWFFCYSMSNFSQKLEKRFNTNLR